MASTRDNLRDIKKQIVLQYAGHSANYIPNPLDEDYLSRIISSPSLIKNKNGESEISFYYSDFYYHEYTDLKKYIIVGIEEGRIAKHLIVGSFSNTTPRFTQHGNNLVVENVILL